MMIRIHNSQYCQFLHQADVLRRSGTLCDAVISVKSQTFRAHRLVLACASRTLAQKLLQGNTGEPLHCTLELFPPHTFQQVLDFSYRQAVEVPVDDLQQLLKAAQILEMQPLEEQCQAMLEKLKSPVRQVGETHKNGVEKEAREVQRTKKASEVARRHLKKEGVHHESSSPPQFETNKSLLMETPSPHETVEESSCPSPTSAPLSPTAPPRDSVVCSPDTGLSTQSSAQPPGLRWHPVDTLRRTAQNYSDMMAAHSFHPSQQLVAYPFCLPSQRMYPLLDLPTQLHGSVVGYSGFLCPYTQHLITGSPELRQVLRKGLLGKRGSINKVYSENTSERGQRYPEECKHTPARLQCCLHCSRPLPDNSWLQGSAPSTTTNNLPADMACAACRFCGRGYRVERSLRTCRHSYSGEKPYQCKRCPKRFSLKHQLDTHYRVHTGEKPFECRLCGQRSRDYSAMIKHLRTHGGATPYQCTVCLEFCSSLAAMQKHLKSHPVDDFPPEWNINSTYLYTSHT